MEHKLGRCGRWVEFAIPCFRLETWDLKEMLLRLEMAISGNVNDRGFREMAASWDQTGDVKREGMRRRAGEMGNQSEIFGGNDSKAIDPDLSRERVRAWPVPF